MRAILAATLVAGFFLLAASQSVNDGYGDYVYVPAGTFKMGDNFNEGDIRERPVHTVELDAFYIGKYPVTNGEYRKFRDDPEYDSPRFWQAGQAVPKDQSAAQSRAVSDPAKQNFPAAAITWDQAVA